MSKRPEQSRRDATGGDREHRERRESGEPGGGAGRRDEVGPTGVYPMSGGVPRGKHPEIRTPAAWGQGKRGADGYNDSGGSELVMRDGELLGGLTAGPGGEPTIDTHGGDRPRDRARDRARDRVRDRVRDPARGRQPTNTHGEQRPKRAKDRDLTSDEPDR